MPEPTEPQQGSPATEPAAEPAAEAVPAYTHPEAGSGHLEERLARVAGAMSRIPKRGFNDHQKYPFVQHGDVVDAVRPALAAEGVRFKAELVKMHDDEAMLVSGDRRATSGLPWTFWTCTIDYTFSCRVEGELEEDTLRWCGYAEDFGDKGPSKAMTGTLKTFLIHTFLLSAGDDPDNPPADGTGGAQQQGGGGRRNDPAKQLQRAALKFNDQLPNGVLGKIARRVTGGEGRITKIEDAALLEKIARNAERYIANPEAGEAWLSAQPQQAAGEPAADDVARQEQSGEPEPEPTEPDGSPTAQPVPGDPGVPDTAGLTLPPAESYDPPLTPDELRQHKLGLNPRTATTGDDDDTPF